MIGNEMNAVGQPNQVDMQNQQPIVPPVSIPKKKPGKIPQKLKEYMQSDNVAESLNDDELNKIGHDVVEGAIKDDESRYEWKGQIEDAMKIVKQVYEGKSFPWPGASDVKYPLMLNACIQFNARTYPEIVKGDMAVHVDVMRQDPINAEDERADRLSEHMSYQVLSQITNWRPDKDKLLMILPMIGICYTKTYYDPIERMPQIDLCLPDDIIVNENTSSLETARRITHVLHMSRNDIMERVNAGLYKDYDDEIFNEKDDEEQNIQSGASIKDRDEVSDYYEIYEQHTWLDLDDDGYLEPYIVVVHKKTEKVLRIVARYDEDSFIFHAKTEKMIKIKPIQFFTVYNFMPSPDGSFHSIGFGTLLYSMNAIINTTINQLMDAATLQNTGGGFIAKSLRAEKESLKFKMGEFKQINVPSGGTLRDSIMAMPTAGPSQVLFSLLQFMVQTARETASISDIMQGQAPNPNMPATSVLATIEQGQKVYSSIVNRLYNSLKSEFQKLYEINRRYLDQYETYQYATSIGEISIDDYRENEYGIIPVADPALSSDAKRLMTAQALMQLMGAPGIDSHEVLTRYLEALDIKNVDKLLPPPNPNAPPSPQMLLVEAQIRKLNMETSDLMMKRELEAMRIDIDNRKAQADAAYKGGQITANKIDSIAEMAKVDALLGRKAAELAERQVSQMQVQAQPTEDITQKLARIEQLLGQQMGLGDAKGQQQPPGAPEGQDGPEGQMPQEGIAQGQEPIPEMIQQLMAAQGAEEPQPEEQ